ncbi:MAG: aspartyl/asparaginyl beta-hydroxylase domain-containing protein [Bacteroidota bacterium]
MTVIKYIRLPFHFDAALLQDEVNELGLNYWQLHYQKLHYEGNWSAIPLRSVGGIADNIFVSPLDTAEYQDTVFLKPASYLSEVLASFKMPLLSVRLLKLDAGASIKEHKDADLCYEQGSIRIHIPVATNNAVAFFLDKERIHLQEGECWYLNFNLPHSIQNQSAAARIHLVIDAKVNDWIKEIFERPAIIKKEIEPPGFDYNTKLEIIAHLRQLNTPTGLQMANEMEAALKIGNQALTGIIKLTQDDPK